METTTQTKTEKLFNILNKLQEAAKGKKATKQSDQTTPDKQAAKQSALTTKDKKATKQSKQTEDKKATQQSEQTEEKTATKQSEQTTKDKKAIEQKPIIKGLKAKTHESKELREQEFIEKHKLINSLKSSRDDERHKKTQSPLIEKLIAAVVARTVTMASPPKQPVTQEVGKSGTYDHKYKLVLAGKIKGMPSIYVDRRVWWGIAFGVFIISMLCCCFCCCRWLISYMKSRNWRGLQHISALCGYVDDAGPINLSLMKDGKKKGSYVISILDESKEGQGGWSSEEEVFNVSAARKSPGLNRTSTPMSTPLKAKPVLQ